ncbi:ABC transporter permease [Calditrichota bacterium]
MFINYLKIIIRSLWKFKKFTILNILGFVSGLTCVLLIITYVQDELSYDSYNTNVNHIVRIARRYNMEDNSVHEVALTNYQLAPKLKAAFPFLKNVIRLGVAGGILQYENKKFYEDYIYLAEKDIFDVFSFNVIKGDPKTALSSPYTMVITDKMAKKYFGNENPLGKVINYEKKDFKITGVIEEIPANSHFNIDFLISMETGKDIYSQLYLENLGSMILYTYVLLPENYTAEKFEKLLPKFREEHWSSFSRMEFFIQPLKDIHLHSQIQYEIGINGDIQYIYIFSLIAILIMLIACINYMNLATARSLNRASEVGMRKVLGASRSRIAGQFIGESIFISMIALFIAGVCAEIAMPFFNILTGKELELNFFANYKILFNFIFLAILVGIFSGSYPAFFLSSFHPINILKKKYNTLESTISLSLRKGLIIFQFTISIILIIGTIFIFNQLAFMRDKKLGIETEQIITVALPLEKTIEQYNTLKKELTAYSYIESVTAANHPLTYRVAHTRRYQAEGHESENEGIVINTLIVDHDFFSTMGGEIIKGRDFSETFPSDINSAYIINESAAKKLKLNDPIDKYCYGEMFTMNGERAIKKGKIIGVVRDFHFSSLHEEIQPVVFSIHSRQTWPLFELLIKINTNDIPAILKTIENKYEKIFPENLFSYTFLDEEFNNLYQAEERLLNITTTFSLLAILIASLGLLGLVAFTTELRTKEIGVRKVLGATLSNIITLLTKDLTKWVFISNIIAWPIAWYAMNNWLQSFAYRIDMSFGVFLLAGGFALTIALLTVSSQAIKAAIANPVESLRYE